MRCACTASTILAGEVSATCPSIPAVLRPALRCVTCRTLTSVFDQLRSIIFCKDLSLARSCSCAALKILPRSRRTLSSCSRQFTASQSRAPSSGPFTCTGVQLALRFRRVRCFVVKGSPATSQPAFTAGHQARYPASYTKTTGRGPAVWLRFPAAFRPPAFASWASCSRQGIRLPLRSAYHSTQRAPRTLTAVSTFRTHETRTGLGALFTPEATVFTRP